MVFQATEEAQGRTTEPTTLEPRGSTRGPQSHENQKVTLGLCSLNETTFAIHYWLLDENRRDSSIKWIFVPPDQGRLKFISFELAVAIQSVVRFIVALWSLAVDYTCSCYPGSIGFPPKSPVKSYCLKNYFVVCTCSVADLVCIALHILAVVTSLNCVFYSCAMPQGQS